MGNKSDINELLNDAGSLHHQIIDLSDLDPLRADIRNILEELSDKLSVCQKELECRNSLTELLTESLPLTEILQRYINIIADHWPYLGLGLVRANIWNKEYRSDNSRSDGHIISSRIRASDQIIGSLEIHYSNNSDGYGRDPAEIQLLESISGQLGKFCETRSNNTSDPLERHKLDAAIDATGMGFWDWNLQTNEVFYDARAARLLGYDPAYITPDLSAWEQAVHPDDKTKALQALQAYIDGNSGYFEMEYRVLVTAEANERWLRDRGRVIERDANGKAIRIVGTVLDITELKKSEEQLHSHAGILQGFFEHTLTPLVLLDKDFNFIRVNEAYARACGRPVSDFPGHNHFEFYPSDARAIFDQVVQTRQPYQAIERPFIYPDHPEWGETFWNWILVPILDNLENIEYLVFSLEDVTERRRAQEQVRQSEEILQKVLGALPVGVWLADKRGKIVQGNTVARKIWEGARYIGIDQYGEFKGWRRDTGERIQARDWAAAKAIESGIVTINEEVEIEAFDGTRKIILNSALPLYNDRQEIIGAFIVNQDITEIKQTEQALKHSEERFRMLFTSMSNSVTLNQIVLNEQGRPVDAIFLEVNPAFEKLTGLNRADIIGKREGEILPFFDRQWIKTCGHVARTRRSVRTEQYIARMNKIFQLTIYSPAPGQFAVIREDITERKLARKALEQKAEELARANTELQQFAYVASHDLQEPLRMISSYLQLIAKRYKDKIDQDANEFIDFAVDGAQRLQNMINDLLEYSRVQTRGHNIEMVDSDTALHHALEHLEVAIQEYGAVVAHDSLPIIGADATQLTQVFQNLISNAIKFRGEQPPQIHITARHRTNDWLFSVQDNGIGIDPKYQERIFVIFQRLYGRDYPGTGIGLAICKRIIERHGGRIWVESEPNKGSTFYFTIPVGGGSNERFDK